LVRAILGYQVERGTKFSTYACKAIMRNSSSGRYVWSAVRDHLRRQRKQVCLPLLKIYAYEVGADPAQQRDWADVCQSLLELVNRLPQRQAEVIRLRYGLEGSIPHTQAEIGIRMGVSRQRVGQIEMQALIWLRQPAHSQELRSLLARHTQAQYELADQLAQAWLRRRGGRDGRRR
jgi:RNA polymerase sigma factor (sigma-70 family)